MTSTTDHIHRLIARPMRPAATPTKGQPMPDLTPEKLADLRRLAELANDLPGGSDWLHGEVGDGTETVAEWMDKCSANPDAPAAGLLRVVWSEGIGEKRVTVQAIVGDTEAAPIRAAFIANANPAVVLALLDAAAFLDEVRAQVARGALCPMCSTGMTRQTVGMVCQLCGTDYGSPEYLARLDALEADR